MTAVPATDAGPVTAPVPGPPRPGMGGVVASSSWMFATMVLMSGSGMVFWLVAARLQTPAEVGYAGTLVSAMVVLALFAQVGLEVTLVQVLPTSSRPYADVVAVTAVVAVVGAVLGAVYGLVLLGTSPGLARVLHGDLGVLVFAGLVAAVAVNGATDSALLAVSRLRANLVINGVVLSALKVGLLVLLLSWGGAGLVLAVGLSGLVAAVASVVVVLRTVRATRGGGRGVLPSRELLDARRYAGAGYVVNVLDVAPFLVFPALVVGSYGAAVGGAWSLASQTMLLLLAVGFALNNAMYAEASKRPDEALALVRRSGLLLLGAMCLGAVALVVAAPLVMRVFGPAYVDDGVPVLRLLAVGAVVAAMATWSGLRLRVAGRLRTMLTTYVLGTALVLGLAWWWIDLGLWAVPLAWVVGRATTLLLNLAVGVREVRS